MLPKLDQHVDCATRGDSTLDLVYTNIKAAYRAASLPHIGSSDHLTVTLQPAYRAKVQEHPHILYHFLVREQQSRRETETGQSD